MTWLAETLLRRRRLTSPSLLRTLRAPDSPGPASRWWKGTGVAVARGRKAGAGAPPDPAEGLLALEADLLRLGYLLSAPLRRRLGELDGAGLAEAGRALLEALAAEYGGHVDHVPLFRSFPAGVPADTFEFYVRRVFALLLQEPEQPCVLCGQVRTVHPVSPCAHLVCRVCWDGADFSACPICHRRVDLDDPFLRPADDPVAEAVAKNARQAGLPDRMVLLRLCEDPAETARELLQELLDRQTPARAEDRAAIEALLGDFWPRSADWLPERIPVRETRSLVLATALSRDAHGARELLERHTDTATDVLRLLYALMGGDPGMRAPLPRRTCLPRPVRRALLDRMARMPVPRVVEDLHRYPEAWKRMAEGLHPFEHHRRHPDVALAFAVLRGTRLDTGTPLAGALLARAAAHPGVVRFDGVRLHPLTFAGRVEAALRDGDHAGALDLLMTRPGELVRRIVHLSRHIPADRLAAAVAEVAPEVSPGVLISALGQLRTPPGGSRVFLPRGGTARIWTEPDTRPPVPAEAVTAVSSVLIAEMLRRAAALPAVERAVLDEELTDLLAPVAERSASSSLVRLPRGSVRPLPSGGRIRLFLHWAQPADHRVDLDLSVALFDERWEFTGLCDYTNLVLGDDAAVHSGDLTSAPEPLGASEFVDLDVTAMRAIGGRYAVPVVFSYNDVPFDRLVRGFAGFMETPPGELFDPLAVRQRFDLAGPAKILVPLVADLWSRTMRWADLNLSTDGGFNDLDEHHEQLARLGSALEDVFGLGDRVTLWEVACWHAAARAAAVTVRHRDGTVGHYRRGPDETAAAFAARLTARTLPDHTWTTREGAGLALPDRGTDAAGQRTPREASFAAVIDDDLDVAEGAQVYALHPGRLDPAGIRALDAPGLVDLLSPATDPVPAA
ncbi:hypothetical protein GCM10010156_73700 [Planobispora rosea]|uniref:RING-type domain-containing protein n=1 Tax=Planobispora rosea TaxID=35762 RepID=A0A8J3S9Q4_PLARO|nr:MXAN_6230/SCO0854 family RING domain-containing protein [Planobispora rosea]GGT05237.1 hypothetical protein GCM10010156_73700 [Planobispora rosea]GIH88677.1 hypothetical protein Pro02_70850 [Planobispora rosea]